MPSGFFALSAIAEYPQEDWGLVFSTVFTGLTVVFLILIILVFLLVILGAVFKPKKNKIKAATDSEQAKPVEAAPVLKTKEIPDENRFAVIAAITAAINAYGEEQGKKLIITGIRKKEENARSAWGRAGISENIGNFFR